MLRAAHRAIGAAMRLQRHAAPAMCSAEHQPSTSRPYSSDEPESKANEADSIGNAKVQKLAAEILELTVLESSWLSELLRKKLNIQKPAFGSMPMGMPMMASPVAAAAPEAAAAAPEEKKEQTEFGIRLESYSPEGKIKVIKEVRLITSLGLKEAKELVEKAPIVIKANVSKEEAEKMKKQIEAVGGKVNLE